MTRTLTAVTAALTLAAFSPALEADVKTRQKSTFKFEGMLGRIMSMAGMGGDPVTSTVSVKGSRMAIGLDPRQASSIGALIPAFGTLATRMADEASKLEGTALLTTSTIETVRSEDELKAAGQQGGGGGIAGGLAGRLMRRNQPQARSTTLIMTHETLSIDPTVAEADLQVPASFKEKK